MNAGARAVELFNENMHMISDNQTAFRRLVMETLIKEFSTAEKAMSTAAAATHYNNAKHLAEAAGTVSGLGRTPKPNTDASMAKKKKKDPKAIIPDNECYTVLEVTEGLVGRQMSFINFSEAKEHLKKRQAFSTANWLLIKGLGPNSGDPYKLEAGEEEII